MKMKFPVIILHLTLSFQFAFGSSITGNVKDKISEEPIRDCRIHIINNDNNCRDTIYTDINGDWSYNLSISGIEEPDNLPRSFSVQQNYPNPFNPSTLIRFNVAKEGIVAIRIFNILGQLIDEKSSYLFPDSYLIEWKSNGASGVYFYSITMAGQSVSRKMIQLDGGYHGGLSEIRKAGGENVIQLSKKTETPLTIITSKLGYIQDTLEVTADDGDHITNHIQTVHSYATVIDLHNDILEKLDANPYYHLNKYHTFNHTDIPRLQEGGVDVQFFAVWVSPDDYPNNPYTKAMEFIQRMRDEFSLAPDLIQQAYNLSECIQFSEENKIAGVVGVEGGHAIENSIDNLKNLYNEGMRYLTITWNNSTDWAVSAQDNRSTTTGLSEFGKQVIRTLDSLGVIIDVSHVGIKTIEDILAISENPIVATHSGARKIRDHYRNLYDEQITAIANTGGVIGVVFYPPFLSSNYSSVNIATVIEHIDYIVDLVGIDYVALGSDFDGIERVPIGLENVTKFPDLTMALLEHGYSQEDVLKILGKNFERVFKTICGD